MEDVHSKDMSRSNSLTFVALLFLTLLSWGIAEKGIAGEGKVALFVVAAMSVKFALIYLVFMEMKHAQMFWKCLGGGYCFAVAILFYSFFT